MGFSKGLVDMMKVFQLVLKRNMNWFGEDHGMKVDYLIETYLEKVFHRFPKDACYTSWLTKRTLSLASGSYFYSKIGTEEVGVNGSKKA